MVGKQPTIKKPTGQPDGASERLGAPVLGTGFAPSNDQLIPEFVTRDLVDLQAMTWAARYPVETAARRLRYATGVRSPARCSGRSRADSGCGGVDPPRAAWR
ncbi:hypothetical protein ABT336_26235 [Micromonospora sp. NPDC000207]|uniref:hypothetical protein n=1 Tax=Micromonospora sp. NPDC000207 TaxID=3154246 RepID=UPI00331B1848